MSARRLEDLVVVITGADGGIGAATARLLAGYGTPVVHSGTTDVRDEAAVRDLARRAVARWGRVDAVVHCAAIVHPAPIARASAASIRDEVETNLLGAINVARAFLPEFMARRRGHLVFMGSLAGTVPLPGEAIYAATKFAVRGFALSLALEMRSRGVDVTVVAPDSTRTAMLDHEARSNGSTLSFASEPLEPAVVARAIGRVLCRPRLEVTVPRFRGALIRLLGSQPWLFPFLYPLLDRQGRRNQVRYRAELGEAV